jgi:hypothetical protein
MSRYFMTASFEVMTDEPPEIDRGRASAAAHFLDGAFAPWSDRRAGGVLGASNRLEPGGSS